MGEKGGSDGHAGIIAGVQFGSTCLAKRPDLDPDLDLRFAIAHQMHRL